MAISRSEEQMSCRRIHGFPHGNGFDVDADAVSPIEFSKGLLTGRQMKLPLSCFHFNVTKKAKCRDRPHLNISHCLPKDTPVFQCLNKSYATIADGE